MPIRNSKIGFLGSEDVARGNPRFWGRERNRVSFCLLRELQFGPIDGAKHYLNVIVIMTHLLLIITDSPSKRRFGSFSSKVKRVRATFRTFATANFTLQTSRLFLNKWVIDYSSIILVDNESSVTLTGDQTRRPISILDRVELSRSIVTEWHKSSFVQTTGRKASCPITSLKSYTVLD